MAEMLKDVIPPLTEINLPIVNFGGSVCYAVSLKIPNGIDRYYHDYFQRSNDIIIKMFDMIKEDFGKEPFCMLNFIMKCLISWNLDLIPYYKELYYNYSHTKINKFLENHYMPMELFDFLNTKCISCPAIKYNPEEHFLNIVAENLFD